MATRTEHVHVVKDESVLGGEPIITGTRTPVRAVFDASGRDLVEREGHAAVSITHMEGEFRLGSWVSNQRRAFRMDRLSPERRQRLEALPGWNLARGSRRSPYLATSFAQLRRGGGSEGHPPGPRGQR